MTTGVREGNGFFVSHSPHVVRTLSLLIIWGVILVAIFWGFSRYPALTEKLIGGATLGGGLSFSTIIDVASAGSLAERIAFSSINWLYTNKEGMTFAVLFAALVLSILQIVRIRIIRNGFLRSVLGALIGTPLGVCANCASKSGGQLARPRSMRGRLVRDINTRLRVECKKHYLT